ncbi:hypothetical protein BGX28_000804 [Mortierella sp. GBA30]|nr:hypothetical protein BGX28_000804 [Mortierella sp. GBA30]
MTRIIGFSLFAALSIIATHTQAVPFLARRDNGGNGALDHLPDSVLNSSSDLSPTPFGADGDPLTQTMPQHAVQLGSDTVITPTTGVFPQLIYRPGIQIYDPLVNDYQTYGEYPGNYDYRGYLGFSRYTGGYGSDLGFRGYDSGYSGQSGETPYDGPNTGFKKRHLGLSGPVCPAAGLPEFSPGLGSISSGRYGPSAGATSCPSGIVGAPSGIAKDTLIRPIVSIQPYASEPVPVPVSQPYNYPVPVGVSVPWCESGYDRSWGGDGDFNKCSSCGWGHRDCDWDNSGNWGGWGGCH